jgi:hypothetical protein
MSDPIIDAARFIAANLEWLCHHPACDEALADIAAAARVVAGIARGPADSKYLGPCGAVLAATAEPCPDGCSCLAGARTALSEACAGCFCMTTCHPVVPTDAEGQICTGDVYAHGGSNTGRCRTCGATVATADRQLWLDDLVRGHAFTDAWIAEALRVPVKTIRSWATDRAEVRDANGRLSRSASPAKLRAHTHDRQGRALYLLGDVADLAAADAARRDERRSNRTRRQETAA